MPRSKATDKSTRSTADDSLEWTTAQLAVLNLKFAGRISVDKMAERVSVSSRTVARWLAHPDFKARLDAMRADFNASLQDVAFADKARRIHALNDAALIALNELETRPLLTEARPTKDGVMTNEAFNNTAMAEFRGALDDIAKELGQRKNTDTGQTINVSGGEVVFYMPQPEQPPQE